MSLLEITFIIVWSLFSFCPILSIYYLSRTVSHLVGRVDDSNHLIWFEFT